MSTLSVSVLVSMLPPALGYLLLKYVILYQKFNSKTRNLIDSVDTYRKRFLVYDSVRSFPLYLMMNSLNHSESDLVSIFDQFGQITSPGGYLSCHLTEPLIHLWLFEQLVFVFEQLFCYLLPDRLKIHCLFG